MYTEDRGVRAVLLRYSHQKASDERCSHGHIRVFPVELQALYE